MQAVASIVGDLTGRKTSKTSLVYVGNHISLGRKDAIFQAVDGDARSKTWALRGRPAARLKALILRGAAFGMSHPTFGMPTRRHRLATKPHRSTEAVIA